MGCIALVRCVLVLRCGSAGVVWYPHVGWSNASACVRIISLFTAQHVSNVSTSIFRSLRIIVDFFMCCIVLVRCVLALRCGSAGVVWYPHAGWGTSASSNRNGICSLAYNCFECRYKLLNLFPPTKLYHLHWIWCGIISERWHKGAQITDTMSVWPYRLNYS